MKEKLEVSEPPGENFITKVLEFFVIWQTQISGGSKGGARDARPSLSPKISSFSCSFWEKFGKNWSNSWLAHPLWEILDRPLQVSFFHEPNQTILSLTKQLALYLYIDGLKILDRIDKF